MAYLADATYDVIRNDPSKVVDYYNSTRSTFISDLGMPGLSEDALRAAWCTMIAYGLAPYGPGPARQSLGDLLASPTLECSSLVSLTWHLLDEFGLQADNITALGWDGGAVGNHAQLLFDDGISQLLLDPTICLVVNGVTFNGLVSGVRYEDQWSFYSRSDISGFNEVVRDSIGDGSYHIRDLIYFLPTFETWLSTSALGHKFEEGAEAQAVIGGLFSDTIDAGAGNDKIYAGKGDDIVIGGAGADYMEGGRGNDAIFVDQPGDQVVEFADQGIDFVYAKINYVLPSNVEYLTLDGAMYGTGNDLKNLIYGDDGTNIISGLAGNDILYGLVGNDLLSGGDNIDTLWGGSGSDTLYGLAGADTFYFPNLDESGPSLAAADLIMDFSKEQGDLVWLAPIDANETVGAVQNFTFIGTAAFSAPGQIRWFTTGTETRVIMNTDSDTNFEGLIRFNGLVAPQSDWFWL